MRCKQSLQPAVFNQVLRDVKRAGQRTRSRGSAKHFASTFSPAHCEFPFRPWRKMDRVQIRRTWIVSEAKIQTYEITDRAEAASLLLSLRDIDRSSRTFAGMTSSAGSWLFAELFLRGCFFAISCLTVAVPSA
jgi:hypothetical protein